MRTRGSLTEQPASLLRPSVPAPRRATRDRTRRRACGVATLPARSLRTSCGLSSERAPAARATMSALLISAGALRTKAPAPAGLSARCVCASARCARVRDCLRAAAPLAQQPCRAAGLRASAVRGSPRLVSRLAPPASLAPARCAAPPRGRWLPGRSGWRCVLAGGAGGAPQRSSACAHLALRCACHRRSGRPALTTRPAACAPAGPGEGQEAGTRLRKPERSPAVRARASHSACRRRSAAWAMRKHLLSSERAFGVAADITLLLTRGATLRLLLLAAWSTG